MNGGLNTKLPFEEEQRKVMFLVETDAKEINKGSSLVVHSGVASGIISVMISKCTVWDNLFVPFITGLLIRRCLPHALLCLERNICNQPVYNHSKAKHVWISNPH